MAFSTTTTLPLLYHPGVVFPCMQRVSGVSVDAPPFALGLPGSTTAAVLVQQGAAVARLQLLAVADGGQQCLAASLEDVGREDALAALHGRRDWDALDVMLDEARELCKRLAKPQYFAPEWQERLYTHGPLPHTDDAKGISFWLAALVAPELDVEAQLEMWLCTCMPRRLRLALMHLHAHPPPPLPPSENRATRITTSRQSLEMERQGGLLPLPPLTSQLTLYELCTQFVGDRVSAYLDELVNLPGHILQDVINRLNARGQVTVEVLAALHDCPEVSNLSLLGADVDDEYVALVADSVYSLREIQFLSCHRLTNANGTLLRALLNAPDLQGLSFERCKRIGDDILEEALPHLPKLKYLSVSGTAVSPVGVLAIGRYCSNLLELDVSCLGQFDDACAAAALGSLAAHCGRLTMLVADKTRLTDAGAAHIAHNRDLQVLGFKLNPMIADWSFLGSLSELVDLDLSLNYQVTDDTVALIADTMPHLRNLWLNKTGVTDNVGRSLARLTGLRSLALGRNTVGDAAVCDAVSAMPQLRSLALDYTGVSVALAERLAGLHHLRTLKLTACLNFGDRALEVLAESGTVSASLAALHVGESNVTNAAIPALQRLQALESLQLWESSVNSVGAGLIQRSGRLVLDTQIRCTTGTYIFLSPRRLAGP